MVEKNAANSRENRAREVARLLAKAALRRIQRDNATGRPLGSVDQGDRTPSSEAEKAQ